MLLKMTFLNFENVYSFILRWNCCKVSTRYLLSSLTLKKWRYAKLKGYSGKEFSVMKIISLLKETDTEWNYFYIFSQIGIARIRYIAVCKNLYSEIACRVRIWNLTVLNDPYNILYNFLVEGIKKCLWHFITILAKPILPICIAYGKKDAIYLDELTDMNAYINALSLVWIQFKRNVVQPFI